MDIVLGDHYWQPVQCCTFSIFFSLGENLDRVDGSKNATYDPDDPVVQSKKKKKKV